MDASSESPWGRAWRKFWKSWASPPRPTKPSSVGRGWPGEPSARAEALARRDPTRDDWDA